MRRAFAIGLAILIVMIATQGAVAQDAERTATDKLLEVLRDRQLISEEEYEDLANRMNEDRAVLDQRLGDLDRSIADYLAKEGDAIGANVTYTKSVGYGHATGERNGFGFASTDGLFFLNIGGLFSFEYQMLDRDRDEFREYDGTSGPSYYEFSKRDRQNLVLSEARWHFSGHAFDPALTYFFEFATSYSSSSTSYDQRAQLNGYSSSQYSEDSVGVSLLDAWVNYNICDWTNVKFGRQKVPFGRQYIVHQSDLQFGSRALPYRPTSGLTYDALNGANLTSGYYGIDRDEGVMVWDVLDVDFFGDPFADFKFEYMAGLFDGRLATTGSWLMPALRGVIYPMGYVDYVESDWRQSDDPTFGFGTSWYYDQGAEHAERHVNAWEMDFVLKWAGFFMTAEWGRSKDDMRGSDARRTRAWYIQMSYMALPNEVELFARYGRVAWPLNANPSNGNLIDVSTEWSLGAAYYWESHNLKALLEFGHRDSEWDTYSGYVDTYDYYDDIEIWFLRLMFQLEW